MWVMISVNYLSYTPSHHSEDEESGFTAPEHIFIYICVFMNSSPPQSSSSSNRTISAVQHCRLDLSAELQGRQGPGRLCLESTLVFVNPPPCLHVRFLGKKAPVSTRASFIGVVVTLLTHNTHICTFSRPHPSLLSTGSSQVKDFKSNDIPASGTRCLTPNKTGCVQICDRWCCLQDSSHPHPTSQRSC